MIRQRDGEPGSHPAQPCSFRARREGAASARKRPCTACRPGTCQAVKCYGCDAWLGQAHDYDADQDSGCTKAGAQRAAYESQLPGRAA